MLLSGCEANPDVNLQNKKFGIKLYIPGADGMEEIWLRFDAVIRTIMYSAFCILSSRILFDHF